MSMLNIERAIAGIRAFNDNVETMATESLVHRHFTDAGRGHTSVAERVVLIDKLWATQMFRKPGHVLKVIKCLERHERQIIDECSKLPQDVIECDPDRLVRVAEKAMPIAFGKDSDQTDLKQYQPYSFATKYLHWISGGRFPIVDSYARQAVNLLQRKYRLQPRVWAGQGEWKSDYPRWIRFYGEQLLPALDPASRDRLINADVRSQSGGTPLRNTLLRILDKAFYQLGPNIV